MIYSMWFGLLQPQFDNAYNEHHKGPYLVLSQLDGIPTYEIVNLGTMQRSRMRELAPGYWHAGTHFTGSIQLERLA